MESGAKVDLQNVSTFRKRIEIGKRINRWL